MTTANQKFVSVIAVLALLVAPIVAARLISPPQLELEKVTIPDELVGEFHGGFSLKNATTGKSDYNFVNYFAVGSDGGFWGMYKPILGKMTEVSGTYNQVEPIVKGTNYTVHATINAGAYSGENCWVVTVKNHTKTNTTSQEILGAFGKECPENKTMANYTAWLKPPKAEPTPGPKEYLEYL